LSTVSVIIPCYKDVATLPAALDSVLAQTRPVDEIIVVNDCSPQSDQIDAAMVDYPQVRYITNPVNVGLAATRNVGIRAATADIITLLDADDQLHPQKIALQLAVYKPEIAVSCQVMRMVDTLNLATLRSHTADVPVKVFNKCQCMWHKNKLVGASIMIDRQKLLEFGGYDDDLRSCEDYDLWLRLLHAGLTVKEVRLPLYLYRINLQGLSRNAKNISYWELQVLERHLRRLDPNFLLGLRHGLVWTCWQIRHLFRYEINPDPEYKQTIRKNISRLESHPILRMVLALIDRGHVMKLPVWFLRLCGQI